MAFRLRESAPSYSQKLSTLTGVRGDALKAFIMHHTAGGGTVDDVMNTLRRRGLGVQYVMDRDGTIYQVGGPGESQMLTGWGDVGSGLSNANTAGMEVIAKDDRDITPEQIAAAKSFINTYYPDTPVYGHGQVNPGHKQETEGLSIVNAINEFRKNPQAAAAQMQQAGYSSDQIRAAFLQAISSTESPGYDVLYGGKEKITDFSRHPNRAMPIFNDKGQVIGHSSAAGKYQFLGSTWEEQAAKHGYKDFSPETQDLAAWNYANDIFKQRTGGSLEDALKSGDPGRINAAANVLNKTWTSLPGGKEQAKSYGNRTFSDVYSQALNAGGGSSVHPPQPTVGTPGPAQTSTSPAVAAADKKKNWLERIGEGLGKVGDLSGSNLAYNVPEQPRAALASGTPTTYGDPTSDAAAKRQQLAEIMARLNTQKLWS